MSDPPALRASGLSHWFGEIRALAQIELDLPPGSTAVVLGPNGSGKTTLTRILATLLRPTRGSVEVLGAELPREAWKARGRIGYLGHRPLLYGELTVAENLRYHATLFGLDREATERQIGRLLEITGMARRADRRGAELSAGMAQRTDICRALLCDPELLILDEPHAHLDEAAIADLEPVLGAAPGRTRVIVTHEIERGLAGADLALVLDRRGHVGYWGPAAGLDPAAARAAYGGQEPGA